MDIYHSSNTSPQSHPQLCSRLHSVVLPYSLHLFPRYSPDPGEHPAFLPPTNSLSISSSISISSQYLKIHFSMISQWSHLSKSQKNSLPLNYHNPLITREGSRNHGTKHFIQQSKTRYQHLGLQSSQSLMPRHQLKNIIAARTVSLP